jgi:hypothetical protein
MNELVEFVVALLGNHLLFHIAFTSSLYMTRISCAIEYLQKTDGKARPLLNPFVHGNANG